MIDSNIEEKSTDKVQAQQTLLSLILNSHNQDKLELSERPDQMVGDNPNTLPPPHPGLVTRLPSC